MKNQVITQLINRIKLLLLKLFACSILFPVAGIAFSAAPDKVNDSFYLTIVSTEPEQLSVITKHQSLSKQFKKLSVISSNDCTNLKPGLVLLVADKTHDNESAKKTLNEIKSLVPDSYLRECDVKPGSLLASGYDFIHESIFKLPEDTISWAFDDIKSELIPFNNNTSFLIEKKFNGNIDDEVEGRQTAVYFIAANSDKPQIILNQCWDFAAPMQKKQMLSFQCMTGMAANHYIHTVYVYDLNKNKIIFENEFCQQASLQNEKQITCLEESVDASGELKLTPRDIEITKK